MIIVALVPLGGLWYISSIKSKEDWTTNIFLNLSKTGDALANKVDGWVEMNLRVLQQNAALEDMVSMNAARQNPVLKVVSDTYEWIYLAFTVQPDGRNVGRSDGKSTKYYGDRAYFQQVMGGRPIGQQVAIGKTSRKPAFILASAIEGAGNAKVGVIAMAMTLVDLSKAIADTKIGETGFAILLEESGKVIAHGKPERITQALQDLSDHPAFVASQSGKPVIFSEEGKEVVAHARQVEQGWTLIIQQDYDEAFAALKDAERNALMLLIITLGVVLIVAYGFARRLSGPIRSLTTVADSMSRGELGAQIVETGRGDEIGALARAIERMGVSIQMAFERLQKK
jgi:methyl-accepting chemotaxis protein